MFLEAATHLLPVQEGGALPLLFLLLKNVNPFTIRLSDCFASSFNWPEYSLYKDNNDKLYFDAAKTSPFNGCVMEGTGLTVEIINGNLSIRITDASKIDWIQVKEGVRVPKIYCISPLDWSTCRAIGNKKMGEKRFNYGAYKNLNVVGECGNKNHCPILNVS